MQTNQIIVPQLPEPKSDELPSFPSYLYEIKMDCGMNHLDVFITPEVKFDKEYVNITLKGGVHQIYLMNVLSYEMKVLLSTPELNKKITSIEDYFRANGMM